MPMARKTLIANGLVVLIVSLLAFFVDARFNWLCLLMGVSLMITGATNRCGFAVVIRRLGG